MAPAKLETLMARETQPEILDADGAARYLGIKKRTLYALAAQAKIPGVKIGGQWRFRRDQLDALFKDHPRPRPSQG